MDKLTVTYTSKRGYCFAVPIADADSLPLSAVQAVKNRSRIVFTTEELQFLNIRINESLKTIFTITADIAEVESEKSKGFWTDV